MITAELFKRAWPYLLGVALVIGALFGAYHHGVSVTDTAWQSKWDGHMADDAKATAERQAQERATEQARQQAINEVTNHAQDQINRAAADAAIARSTADSLRDAADRLASDLADSEASLSACATQASKTAAWRARLLADVFKRADERAGRLAAIADQARARGLACELAYDALSKSDER